MLLSIECEAVQLVQDGLVDQSSLLRVTFLGSGLTEVVIDDDLY